MKWTHRFRINAPVEALYENGFAPDRWFTFYKAYRGLESVDDHWPEEGSSIVVRYALLGPWTVRMKQTAPEINHSIQLTIGICTHLFRL